MIFSRIVYFLSAALSSLVTSCSHLPPPTARASEAEVVGVVADSSLNEISGIARSLRSQNVFWTHNDSGAAPTITALSLTGETLATVNITNARAQDWEDIASFTWRGEPWILIADAGDNGGVRTDTTLYLLPEPELDANAVGKTLSLSATHILHFNYPDGPRDCEGVAVSPSTDEILLISKRTEPPVLYSLSLSTAGTTNQSSQIATRLNPLKGVVPPSAAERAIPGRLGQYRSNVTAFDLSPDNTSAAVLTYGNIWLYRRTTDEPWTQTLSRDPERIPVRGLPQAEALCFSPDGKEIWITTEAVNAPIQRYRLSANPTEH